MTAPTIGHLCETSRNDGPEDTVDGLWTALAGYVFLIVGIALLVSFVMLAGRL